MGLYVSRLTDLTTKCIRCGFCLESCPTFLETGEETESPRGRIYLVRSAEEGRIAWEDTRPHIDQCLGCRACETACPSAVQYGEILELARDRLERHSGISARRILLKTMTRPKSLRMQLSLGKLLPGRRIPRVLSRLLSGQDPEANRPTIPVAKSLPLLNEAEQSAVRGKVFVLEGCVMRVLYPHVNEITKRLLRRIGFETIESRQGCCGALHAHNGYLEGAKAMRAKLSVGMPDHPIVVNSAGCGSWLKEGAIQAVDASEFLFANGLGDLLVKQPAKPVRVTYHDACHLSHGQGIRSQPRQLLQSVPGLELIELNEAEMCCGSAGIYNLTQPKMARQLLERKWRNIEATGAQIVATGNPGCHAWIRQAAEEHGKKVEVLHTLEVLEHAFTP
jgi:glycolate oxidase iron-sulfur subunit